MTTFDWGRFAEACETAERQFQTNAPLPQTVASGSLVDDLKAAQPFVDKGATFVRTKPGSITASLTVLAELKRQGFGWAVEAEEIVSAAAHALPTASDGLSEAISVMEAFAAAATPGQGGDAPVGGRR